MKEWFNICAAPVFWIIADAAPSARRRRDTPISPKLKLPEAAWRHTGPFTEIRNALNKLIDRHGRRFCRECYNRWRWIATALNIGFCLPQFIFSRV